MKLTPQEQMDKAAEWNRMHNPQFQAAKDAADAKRAEKQASDGNPADKTVPGESSQTQQAVQQSGQGQMPTTPPPPGTVYAPDPAKGEAARVGVPGKHAPPPPSMAHYKLPNLTPDERTEEEKFMKYYENNPDAVADEMIAKAGRMELGNDGPNFFGTDDAKNLFPAWKGSTLPDGKTITEETRDYRAKYNTALHQTANAIAKRAFLKYLDTVVSKLPPERQNVLVTAGGVAAGKGHAIANIPEVLAIRDIAGAVWDTAGEQNSTELSWVSDECKKRGFKMTAAYIHADPTQTWESPKGGVISRAAQKGRMVDARAYAESYAYGPKNFKAWHHTVQNDPNVHVAYINNPRGATPEELPDLPHEALNINPDQLHAHCLKVLETYDTFEAARQGGFNGVRYWGAPSA